MSNVKPGDLAKVVGSTHGNEGRICYVDGPSHWDAENGLCWMVTLLQPSNVRDDGVRRFETGAKVWGLDKRLRRIDPPADSSDDAVVRELERSDA